MTRPTIAALACGLLLAMLATTAHAADLLDWDFDDGTDGPFHALGPGWEVVDGTYHCYTEGFATFSSSIAGDPGWMDYIATFDVRASGGANHVFRFRVSDFQDYYELNLRGDPFHDVTLGRMDYLGYAFLTIVETPIALGEWHHVEVMVEDYTIIVTVDGAAVLTYTDTERPAALRSGSIALVSLSGGEVFWQDVWFDNVRVTTTVVPVESSTLSDVKQLFR
jgi:hypothetical protein